MIKYKHYITLKEIDASKIVEMAVDTAPDYYDGKIESLGRQVEELTKILGIIVGFLTEEQKDILAQKLHFTKVLEF